MALGWRISLTFLMSVIMSASAQTEGSLRLVNGERPSNGRVEIFHNNTWGTICDDGWEDSAARVVCHQLGFVSGHSFLARDQSYFGLGTGRIWLNQVRCQGSEQRLTQCRHWSWGHTLCSHLEDAGVDCDPNSLSMDKVRLVGGSNNKEGRVEIFHNNAWGTVCSDHWYNFEAQVVCRQLGFTGTVGVPLTDAYFTNGTGNPQLAVSLSDVRCQGREAFLSACRYKPWGSNDCGHSQDAGVLCLPAVGDTMPAIKVRLADGPNKYTGRVEIQAFGKWGTVCDDGFDDQEAQVVCRQLGFLGGSELYDYSPGRGPIWLDDVRCVGTETSLLGCTHKPWGITNCQHGEDVVIACQPPQNQMAIVPSIEGGGTKGRLLATVNGRLGTVCDDYATNAVAMVVCRQLGFNTTNPIVTRGSAMGSTTLPIVLDDVRCVGTEDSLSGCRFSLNNNCGHSEDLGVDCQTGYSGLNVRLVDPQGHSGSNVRYGRLEVSYNGTWGTVCDDSFSNVDARVICNQLGFAGNSTIAISTFGGGTGPIWIDELECLGNEPNIASCRHSGYGVNDCNHNEDVGIYCPGAGFTLRARLVGPTPREGRVEVTLDGQTWGTVCDDSFNRHAAAVVCRMLGYNATSPQVFSSRQYGPGNSSKPILLDDVHCTGRETNLLYCSHRALGSSDCTHSEDVGVLCTGGSGSGAGALQARLVNGTSTTNGRLEIYYNGTWSTVCDDSFGTPEALVACRMLGFHGISALVVSNSVYGPGRGTIILDDLQCSGTEQSLEECGNKGYYNHNCAHSEDVGVQCDPQAVHLRLGGINRRRYDMGRVELRIGGDWGTVCDDNFDANAAKVVCRQLNYASRAAVAVTSRSFGAGHGRILLDDVTCNGNETSILDCYHRPIGTNNCDHDEDVGVICRDVTPSSGNMTARLVGPAGSSEGRLEIRYNDQWGTVCDDGFRTQEAKVACAMLGMTNGVPRVLRLGIYPAGTGIIWMDDVDCYGNETSLDDCSHRPLGTSNCGHGEDVAISCSANAHNTPLQIRLRVNSTSGPQGRVEVNHAGVWGTICDDNWGLAEAGVVCEQLGYHRPAYKAIPMASAYYGRGTGRIWLDEVNCTGLETNLADCGRKAWGYNDCTHNEDAGVYCMATSGGSTPVQYRLSGGASMYEGRVEVRYRNFWGTVCDDGFDVRDAQVVCRSLGYSGGRVVKYVGTGRGPIWMDDVQCQGNEISLDHCHFPGWAEHDCDHYEDVGVNCTNPHATSLFVRLRDGGDEDMGRVEVLYRGKWGTVCDTDFDDAAAAVVCRQLGYHTGTARAFGGARFGQGQGRVWLQRVQCLGAESKLNRCNLTFDFSGHGSCDHSHDVGVACNGGTVPDLQVRLVGGGNRYEGRVELRVNGTWGTICDDNWDARDASVICRMLNLTSSYSLARSGGHFPLLAEDGSVPIWLDDVECSGNETTIAECAHRRWGHSNCMHNEDAGVVCFGYASASAVRLVGGLTPHEGRVEVYHNGSWGTICDDEAGPDEAAVICRTLGFQAQGARAISSAAYGQGTGPIWLDDLSCAGTERFLDMCAYRPWGDNNCRHSEDLGVACGDVPSSVEVRLVGEGSTPNSGRVELRVNGTWGTVCDDLFDYHDAGVVCAMLGFPRTGARAVLAAHFGAGSGPILLDDLQCQGTEESLLECPSKPLYHSNCGHGEDAGVICPNGGGRTHVRLVPGPSRGRLEVQYNGTWGTVCDDYVLSSNGRAVAQVVCRMLGQPYAGAYLVRRAGEGPGSGQIWLDNVQCTGVESSLFQCRHAPWGTNNCIHTEDLGVVCSSVTSPTTSTMAIPRTTPSPQSVYVTLVGRGNAYAGRVAVFYHNTWGTVCDTRWSDNDADVICGMLGYARSGNRGLSRTDLYGVGSGPTWVDSVQCMGAESSLAQCPTGGWGHSHCSHTHDAGVVCSSAQEPSQFLLFTDTDNRQIYRMDLNSFSFITLPVAGHQNPVAIDYDSALHRIYWTDVAAKEIRSAGLDGSNPATVRRLGTNSVADGIAVDSASQLIFYTDTGADIVAVVAISGFAEKVVVNSDLDEPRAIVLSYMNGVMFWSDWGIRPKIERANYDGTSRQAIVTSGLVWPNALALDLPNQRLYWVDSSDQYPDKIEWSDLFGNHRTKIYTASAGAHFYGMAYYNNELYLSDWDHSSHEIKRLNVNGTGLTLVGPSTFGRINGVHVHVDSTTTITTACTAGRGGCSHICVPTPGGGRKCLCPDGLNLQADGRTCGTGSSCPKLTAPAHVSITPSLCTAGAVLSGQLCSVTCTGVGFTLRSAPTLSCLPSGLWSNLGAPIVCADTKPPVIQCPGAVSAVAEKGRTSALVSWRAPTASDNGPGPVRVATSMSPPIRLQEGTYTVTATAIDAQGLQSTCSFSVVVTVHRCPAFTLPAHARLVTSPCPTHNGAACTVACDPGYELNVGSSMVVTCQAPGGGSAAGRWDSVPDCTPMDCPPLPPPVHGSLSCNNGAGQGRTCNVMCDSGYTLTSGLPSLSCSPSGQWDNAGVPLICSDTDPPHVTCPNDVTQTATSGTSMQVTWKAATANDNAGDDQVTLTYSWENGATFPEGQSRVTVRAYDRAGHVSTCSFTVTVKVLRCPTLLPPQNGQLLTSPCPTWAGSECQVACYPGYRLTPASPTLTCTAARGGTGSAAWSAAPACTAITCTNPPTPPNGAIAGCPPPITSGTTCTQKCNPGYVLTGGTYIRTCRNDGSWTGQLANCTSVSQAGGKSALTGGGGGSGSDSDSDNSKSTTSVVVGVVVAIVLLSLIAVGGFLLYKRQFHPSFQRAAGTSGTTGLENPMYKSDM